MNQRRVHNDPAASGLCSSEADFSNKERRKQAELLAAQEGETQIAFISLMLFVNIRTPVMLIWHGVFLPAFTPGGGLSWCEAG